MNSITQKTFILAGMTLLILLITGCPQPHGKGIAPKIPPAETPSPGGNVNSGTKPGSSSSGANTGSGSNSATNPGSPGTVQEEKIDITEEELLTALSLTRGSQSAAEAAKKIAAQTGKTVSGLTFTEANYLAYDDEKETFTVQVKGKKAGKVFDKTFTVSGFVHPYKNATPQTMLTPGKKLILDKAIKSNLSRAEFIKQAKMNNGVGYVFFKIKLTNGKEVELGKYDSYNLTPSLKEEGTDKVRINGIFETIFEKYENGTVSSQTSSASYLLNNIMPSSPYSENYFTQKDVFDYIAKELTNDPSFMVADAGAYASAKYAPAMILNNGSSFFDSSKLDKYNRLYNTEATDKHLKITNIIATIDNLRNGGISPDDYKGEMAMKFYISSADDPSIQSQTYTATGTGFKRLPADISSNVHSVLAFSLGRITGGSGTQDTWKNRSLNTTLISMKESNSVNSTYSDWFTLNDDLKSEGDSSGFSLILNGENYTSQIPHFGNKFLVPIYDNSAKILIKQLNISKNAGDEYLTITVQFMGGDHPETISIKPKD